MKSKKIVVSESQWDKLIYLFIENKLSQCVFKERKMELHDDVWVGYYGDYQDEIDILILGYEISDKEKWYIYDEFFEPYERLFNISVDTFYSYVGQYLEDKGFQVRAIY